MAQPGRLRRPGRGLEIERSNPQPIHLSQDRCVFKRAEPALYDASANHALGTFTGSARRICPMPLPTLATITVAAVICGAVFHNTVLRAWPLNVISVAAASAIGRDDLISTALPYAALNPRSASASWGASRLPGLHPQNETYILIIGETVRADRLGACGGHKQVGISHQDAIIYCDV